MILIPFWQKIENYAREKDKKNITHGYQVDHIIEMSHKNVKPIYTLLRYFPVRGGGGGGGGEPPKNF